MKPLPSYAVFLTLIFFHATQAQKIVYSPPEKTDYNRFRFQVITKRDDKILVFKSVYLATPLTDCLPPRPARAMPIPIRCGTTTIPTPDPSTPSKEQQSLSTIPPCTLQPRKHSPYPAPSPVCIFWPTTIFSISSINTLSVILFIAWRQKSGWMVKCAAPR